MDFGYDLLANPQKVKPYGPSVDISHSPQSLDIEKNIELLGRPNRPDFLLDMIEDEIVEHIPHIHTKIDNQTLREIIHISVQQYQKIEDRKKLDLNSKNKYTPINIPKTNIIQPKIEKPKFININPKNMDFGLKKLH